jgi:hypothetical protein
VFRSAKQDDAARAVARLITSGFDHGGTVRRGGENGRSQVRDAFRPMMLVGVSSNGATFWHALTKPQQSRCVRTTVTKAPGSGRPKTSTREFYAERDRVASDLAAWATGADIDLWTDVPHEGRLDDRTTDKWRPLVAMAVAAGGPWPDRVAACIEAAIGDDAAAVPPKRIVADTHKACHESPLLSRATNPYGVAVAALTEALVRLGSPWDGAGVHDRLTDARLRELLKDYRVTSQRQPHSGAYRLPWTELDAMWDAYLPKSGSETRIPETPSPPSPPSPETATTQQEGTSMSNFGGIGETVPRQRSDFGGSWDKPAPPRATGCSGHRDKLYGWHSACADCISIRKVAA